MYGEIQENNNAGYRVAIKPGHRPTFCCLTIFGWVGARNVGLIKMLFQTKGTLAQTYCAKVYKHCRKLLLPLKSTSSFYF